MARAWPHMQPSYRVTLELEAGASPIQGWVAAADGHRSRFDGYVQLIGRLESLQGIRGTNADADDTGGFSCAGSDTD
jgi:hypothetical protein